MTILITIVIVMGATYLGVSWNQGMPIVMTIFVVSGNHRGWGEDGLGLVEGSWGREDGTNPLCWGDSDDSDDDSKDFRDDNGGDGDIDDVSSNDNLDRMLNYMFVSSQHDREGYKHSCQDFEL